jgi:hypothetical protein
VAHDLFYHHRWAAKDPLTGDLIWRPCFVMSKQARRHLQLEKRLMKAVEIEIEFREDIESAHNFYDQVQSSLCCD